VDLEANLKKAETLAPKKRKMLGCYVVDYGLKQGTPLLLMKLQCETGLRWIPSGCLLAPVWFIGRFQVSSGILAIVALAAEQVKLSKAAWREIVDGRRAR